MAFNAGTITAALNLTTAGFSRALQRARTDLGNLRTDFRNAFGNGPNGGAGAMNNAAQAAQEMQHSLRDVNRIVSGILISQAFYQGTHAIVNATGAVMEFSGEMEKAQISFEYFLGTEEEAKGFIHTMKEFAASTSFNTEQSLALSRKMMGAQFDPTEVKSVMEILNDASAATGGTAEQLDRVVLALTQVKTNGKIAGQELRQFAEAGIPVYQLLKEELGLTSEQLSNIGDMKIDGDLGVAAILSGLKKRYKGAADEIADTMPGMMQTIKDSLLMVTSTAMAAPYEEIKKFTTKWRDAMNDARKAVDEGGIGGLFEKFVPESIQEPIRMIVKSIQVLASNAKLMYKAWEPALQLLGKSMVAALSIVMPILATISNVTVKLTEALFNASPAVKVFAAAVMGLLVANTAARALVLLWSVTRMGAICTAVAGAVMTLARAIGALLTVLLKNGIARVIAIAAAALVYFASKSEMAARWMAKLNEQVQKFLGLETDGVLIPTEAIDTSDEYNKQIDLMEDSLKNVGKEADKAGKKVKDKFLASFDEVFNIPEKLDDVTDAFVDPVPFEKLPEKEKEKPKPKKKKKKKKDEEDDDGWFFPAIGAITSKWKKFLDDMKKRLKVRQTVISKDLQTIKDKVKETTTETVKTFATWGAEIGSTAFNWTATGAMAVVNFATAAFDALKGFTHDGASAVWEWASGTAATMLDWATNTKATIDQWKLDTGVTLGLWALEGALAVSKWFVDTKETVKNWSIETAIDIASWSVVTLESFLLWVTESKAKMKTWATETALDFASWSTNTVETIQGWSTNTQTNIGIWATATGLQIATWATTTAKNVGKWATNTAGNIGSWANTNIANTSIWAKSTASTIGSWIASTSGGVAKWTNNVLSNFGAFANGASGAVAAWASSSWKTFGSWLSGTASAVATWANNTLTNIVSWAQSAWSALASLAKSTGSALKEAYNYTAKGATNAAINLGNWAGENKSWLIPTAIAAVAVGAVAAIALSGGAATPFVAPLLALEKGGVVDKEQLVRIGEKNRREVVIPMENPAFMQPFSSAVAKDLFAMGGMGGGSSSGNDERPILYVGTLIADDRSLTELERRMQVIKMNEESRGVRR